MSTQPVEIYKPNFNVLYGITHDIKTGEPIIRMPRSIKVGIGLLAGPDIHAYIDPEGNWKVVVYNGVTGGKRKIEGGKKFSRNVNDPAQRRAVIDEVKAFYFQERKNAPVRKAPDKLAYFTFSKSSSTGDGTLEPDFETIDRHGIMPTAIDILFTDDDPLRKAYEYWKSSGLQCRGNGKDAERAVEFAQNAEERAAAEQAKADGKKVFPIIDKCWMYGCQFAQPLVNNNGYKQRQCAPHGKLSFQLMNDIRLCAHATFDTTSVVSVDQIFSAIHTLLKMTGGGDPSRGYVSGIPLRMIVRPFKTNVDGKPGKAYAASLEFRAESAHEMQKKLVSIFSSIGIRQSLPPAAELKQIEAPVTLIDVEEEIEPVNEAAMMTAEFSDGEIIDNDDLGDPADAQPPTDSDKAAEASVSRTAELREKLAAQTEPSETVKALRQSAIADEQPAAEKPSEAPQPVFLTAAMVKDRARQVASPDLSIPAMEQFMDAVHAEGLDTKEPAAAYQTFTNEWRKVVAEAAKKQGGGKGGFNF